MYWFGYVLIGGARAVVSVAIAHALAYWLVGWLPQVGISFLGLGAAQDSVLTGFAANTDVADSYLESVKRLVGLDLGKSLDGIPIQSVLTDSLWNSLPIFVISTAILTSATALAFALPRVLFTPMLKNAFEFLTFLPAFVPAFLLLVATVAFGETALANDSWQRWFMAGVCVAIVPTSFALSVMRDGFDRELAMPYTMMLRAIGMTERRVISSLRKTVALQLAYSFEKIITLQITVLIFTEIVFAMPGFGSTLLLGAQRTDANTIIAFVLVVSAIISTARFIGSFVNDHFDPRQVYAGA